MRQIVRAVAALLVLAPFVGQAASVAQRPCPEWSPWAGQKCITEVEGYTFGIAYDASDFVFAGSEEEAFDVASAITDAIAGIADPLFWVNGYGASPTVWVGYDDCHEVPGVFGACPYWEVPTMRHDPVFVYEDGSIDGGFGITGNNFAMAVGYFDVEDWPVPEPGTLALLGLGLAGLGLSRRRLAA